MSYQIRPKPFPSIESIVAYAKETILDDCLQKIVPHNLIERFEDLHDFVDANDYLRVSLPDDPVDLDAALTVCNVALSQLDDWIMTGGLASDLQSHSIAKYHHVTASTGER